MKKKTWVFLGIGIVVLLLLAGALFVYYSTFGEEELGPGIYRQQFRINGNQIVFTRNQQDPAPDWESSEKDSIGFVGTLSDNEAEQIQQALDKCLPLHTKWDALAFARSFPKKLGEFGDSDVYTVKGFYYYEQSNQWWFGLLPLESIPDDHLDFFSAVIETEVFPIFIVIDGESMEYIYGWGVDYREAG